MIILSSPTCPLISLHLFGSYLSSEDHGLDILVHDGGADVLKLCIAHEEERYDTKSPE